MAGERVFLIELTGLNKMPPQNRIGRRPAYAGAGGALIADLPPVIFTKVFAGRNRASVENAKCSGVAERLIVLGVLRKHTIENANLGGLLCHTNLTFPLDGGI